MILRKIAVTVIEPEKKKKKSTKGNGPAKFLPFLTRKEETTPLTTTFPSKEGEIPLVLGRTFSDK
jgi:hypothetical protein